ITSPRSIPSPARPFSAVPPYNNPQPTILLALPGSWLDDTGDSYDLRLLGYGDLQDHSHHLADHRVKLVARGIDSIDKAPGRLSAVQAGSIASLFIFSNQTSPTPAEGNLSGC